MKVTPSEAANGVDGSLYSIESRLRAVVPALLRNVGERSAFLAKFKRLCGSLFRFDGFRLRFLAVS
ncbi:MAG: hypothetical protein QM741_10680 [Rudaea sp.]|uniref:hypothetical protein n=1 Tax=Rudaea sp. TaxID=2136325 RepID=UPI0039E577AF